MSNAFIHLHEFYPNGYSNALSTTSRSWRPKLTPYRAFVLSSTIGLGSAKAYATSRDSPLVETTIEWIAGVVLFSVLFILGLLEPNPPRCLLYFFEHDLVDLPPIFGYRSFNYENEPRVLHPTNITRRLHPPITGYRLLTSVSVGSFARLVKAYLRYQHSSQASNAVDWISGVLLTSCLYVLGLYEDNPVGLMPYLFFFDYTPLLLSGSLVASHVFGLLLCCVWVGYWAKTLFFPLPDIRAIYDGTDGVYYPVHIAPTTIFQGVHNVTQFAFYAFGNLLIPLMGVICFIVIFFKLCEYPGGVEGLEWVKATIRGIILSSFALASRVARTMGLVSWIRRPLRGFRKLILFFRRFSLHILVYTLGALVTGVFTFNILGIISILWFEVNSPSLFTYVLATYFTIIGGIPFCMAGCMCGYCLVLLVAPFRVDWDAPEYRRTFFELGDGR